MLAILSMNSFTIIISFILVLSCIKITEGAKRDVIAQIARVNREYLEEGYSCWFAAKEFEQLGNSLNPMESYSEAAIEYNKKAQELKDKGYHGFSGHYYSILAKVYQKLGNLNEKKAHRNSANEYIKAAREWEFKKNHRLSGGYYKLAAKEYEKSGDSSGAKEALGKSTIEYKSEVQRHQHESDSENGSDSENSSIVDINYTNSVKFHEKEITSSTDISEDDSTVSQKRIVATSYWSFRWFNGWTFYPSIIFFVVIVYDSVC